MASSTIILITGANSGIGYASAKIIGSASSDYHIIVGSRNPKNGEATVEELKRLPGIKGSFTPLQIDITDSKSIENAVQEVTEQFGRVDVFINNAGIANQDPSLEVQLRTTLDTNVIGAALVSEAFIPLLLKSKNPYLMHVTSGLGSLQYRSDPKHGHYEVGFVAYRMSKAALNMLMTNHHKELGPKGVKVFSVCPGLVVSNLRGKDEASRQAGGLAISADTSGEFFLSVIQGKRDQDAGKAINRDGIHPW